jgi:hypothetical protein
VFSTGDGRHKSGSKALERCGLGTLRRRRTDTDALSLLEGTILRILEVHKGRDNSVSRKDLVEKINAEQPLVERSGGRYRLVVDEREIRRVMKHLREQHGERIGSTGRGYFIAETADEVKAISRYHRKRALSELYSAARIERSSLPELLGQLSLEIGG